MPKVRKEKYIYLPGYIFKTIMIRNNDQDPSLGLKIIPVIRGLFGDILHQNVTSLDFLCSLVSSHPPEKSQWTCIYFNKPEKVVERPSNYLYRREFAPKDPRLKPAPRTYHQGAGHPGSHLPWKGKFTFAQGQEAPLQDLLPYWQGELRAPMGVSFTREKRPKSPCPAPCQAVRLR